MLLYVKGAKSFEDLKIYNEVAYGTYEATARAMGLCKDDGEWRLCMLEHCNSELPKQLRNLFVTLLVFCCGASETALSLWEEFKDFLSEDYAIENLVISTSRKYFLCLREINRLLMSHYNISGNRPYRASDFGLNFTAFDEAETNSLTADPDDLLLGEISKNLETGLEMKSKLNSAQLDVFQAVIRATKKLSNRHLFFWTALAVLARRLRTIV